MKMKRFNINVKKVSRTISFVLFFGMLILIYMISPRITTVIQDMAKYIYEIDPNYITRVVELILAVSLIITAFIGKENRK